jgi:CheY-like chemotaxis protein
VQSAAAIVVVDDEQDISELIGHVLEREGHRVFCASSAAEALRHLQDAEVDLIVTDYSMPDMDGAAFLRTLCGNLYLADIPVIVVSAFPEEQVRMNCATMQAFVQKPFKNAHLLQVVREILS